jgi:effector-binding domain-containing protein
VIPVNSLPAVEQAATIVHRGSMDDVMPTIQTLARWIEANGYTSAGYNRELYVSYGEGPGPWAVELQEPVKR